MRPSPTSKTATSQIETGLYTEAFAAVLAEQGAPAPISVPVEVRRTVPVHRGPTSDDARHLPALKAGALGWLLLLSIGAASWYSIVDPIWSIPITIPSPVTTLLIIRPSTSSLWAIEDEKLRMQAERAAAAADEWVFATIDLVLPRHSEIGVETAALSTPATAPPSQTTRKPALDLIASFVETTPNAPTSSHRFPIDIIGVGPGDDLEKPVTGRNGEAKGTIGNPFVDLIPEKPQSGWPNISTASRAGTGTSQSEDPQSDSSSADAPDAKGKVTPNAGSQDPHPGGGAPSGSKPGKKDSKSDKAGPSSGGKGPKAGKDKPSAGKSAPAGPKGNHNSNRSGPSAGKADHDKNSKSDADKKDKGSGGKDNGGKGPH